jgi:hypothetical protein
MNARLLLTLIACTSELAVGQILFLSLQNDIFYFSRLPNRVAGTGWKALPANRKRDKSISKLLLFAGCAFQRRDGLVQLIHAFATSVTVDQTE